MRYPIDIKAMSLSSSIRSSHPAQASAMCQENVPAVCDAVGFATAGTIGGAPAESDGSEGNEICPRLKLQHQQLHFLILFSLTLIVSFLQCVLSQIRIMSTYSSMAIVQQSPTATGAGSGMEPLWGIARAASPSSPSPRHPPSNVFEPLKTHDHALTKHPFVFTSF